VNQDKLAFGSTVIPNMNFCSATSIVLYSYDAIIGLAAPGTKEETGISVFNAFISQGDSQKVVSFWYNPASVKEGEITFGGIDDTKFEQQISYSSLPDKSIWAINCESIIVGNETVSNSNIVASVDTGTNLLLLPTSIFNLITKQTHFKIINGTKFVNCADAKNFAPLTIKFSGIPAITLSGEQQVYNFNGECLPIYKAIDGDEMVAGQLFIQNVYTVFDFDNARIGFANLKGQNRTIVGPRNSASGNTQLSFLLALAFLVLSIF
jgi:cathepsin D